MSFSDLLRSITQNPLASRIGEHFAAERSQSTDAPIVGGMYNKPIIGIPARVAGSVLNAAGLAQEPFNKVANAGAGEIALLAALAQVTAADHGMPGVDPNGTATQASRATLEQGAAHPGRAIQAMRTGPDSGLAWLAGALEMASNPLNYAGGIGEAGTGLRAGGEAARTAGNAPLLGMLAETAGRGLQGVGVAGEATNRLSMLPLSLVSKGGREALTELPAFLRGSGPGVSNEAQSAIDQLNGLRLPPAPPPVNMGAVDDFKRSWLDFGLTPESKDYAQYAKTMGFPVPGALPHEASALAPDIAPSLTALAAQRAGGVEHGRMGLPLIPELQDVRIAQREQSLPLATRVPDLGPSPLVPERTPNLVQVAKRFQNAAENGPLMAPERMPGPLPPLPPPLTPAELRAQTVKGVANGPLANLTAVLRDLHGSVYPNGQTDFAIPSLTGVAARDFRTSLLTDHPSGNAAEPYLDYLISRVQGDPKAAARLGASNPDLLDEIGRVAAHDKPLTEQKRALQAALGAGPFKATEALPVAPGATEAAGATIAAPALAVRQPWQMTREALRTSDNAPIGSWRLSRVSDELQQLREIAPGDINPRERMGEKSSQDIANYTDRLRNGELPPPILAAETPEGLTIIDGHRRWAAAQALGQKMRAWVMPTIDPAAVGLSGTRPLPLTRELAAKQALLAGETLPADVLREYPDLAQALTGEGAQGFADLVASRDNGKMGAYLPGAEFFAKRLGIPVQEAQGHIDDLVRRGVVADERGALAFKPGASTFTPHVDIPAPQDLPDMAPDGEFVAAIQRAATAGKDDEVNALVDVAHMFGLDQGQAQRIADEALGITGREANQAATLAETRLQDIEASPYFAAFKYFNPRGELKATNPITGKRIINRTNGRISAMREGVGNVVGNGYDEVADNLIAEAQAGGHNQNYNQTAEEFWTNAQRAFKEWQGLTGAPTEVLGPMGLRKPKGNTGVPASLPGVDMRPQFGGGSFTGVADTIPSGAAAPLKLEMQYGGLAPEAVQRVKAVDAGQQMLGGLDTPAIPDVPTLDEVIARTPQRGIGRMERSNGRVETWPTTRPEDLALELHKAGITRSGDSAPREIVAKRFADLTPQEAAMFFGERYDVGSGLRTVKNFLATLKQGDNAATIARGAAAKADLFGDAADVAGPAAARIMPLTNPTEAIRFIDDAQARAQQMVQAGADTATLQAYADELKTRVPEIRRIFDDEAARHFQAGGAIPQDERALHTELATKLQRFRRFLGTSDSELLAEAKNDLINTPKNVGMLQHVKANDLRNGPTPKKLPGGDIAAGGGGGMGIVPRVGGRPLVLPAAASRSLLGAGIGGAVGGTAGALQDDQDRLGGFTRGSLIGMGAGAAIANANVVGKAGQDLIDTLPKALHGTVISPDMQEKAIQAGIANQAAVDAAQGVKGIGRQAGAARAQWRAQMVNTLKQLPQDAFQQAITRWGIAGKEFGVTAADARRWQAGLADERAGGVSNLANPVTAWLRDLGLTDKLGDLGQNYGIDFGGSLTEGADKQLGTTGRMVAGAGMSGFAGTPSINPVTLAVGAIKGKYQPFIDGYIRFLNGIQHDAARFAMAEKALDRDVPVVASEFLSELARMGHNVKPLEALHGRMSAADVAAVAGKQAGADWAKTAEALVAKQGDRIAYLNGDFRKSSETAAERAIGNVAPFARWSIRYAPVLAEIAARHPRVALLVGQEMYRENADAKGQGKPAYQRGVTITDETPGVGLAARLRNGGAKGSLTLDPLGAAMPYGSLLDGGEAMPTDATGYQKVVNLAGRFGFSPDPLIQAGAYIGGQDYRAPGNLSRTAGLENSVEALPSLARLGLMATGHKDIAAAIPDLPQLPSGRQLLDAGRNLLEPVTGEKAVAASDPVMRRYDELVLRETGLPLDDPENRDYLAAAGKPSNPLWQRAVGEARLAGAATNLTGLASPVATSAQTVEAEAAQRAKAALPVPGVPSYLPSSAKDRALLPPAELAARARNASYVLQTPEAGTYNVTNRADASQTLLRDLTTRYTNLGLPYTQAQLQAQYDLLNGGSLFGQELFPGGAAPDLTQRRYDPTPLWELQRFLNGGR